MDKLSMYDFFKSTSCSREHSAIDNLDTTTARLIDPISFVVPYSWTLLESCFGMLYSRFKISAVEDISGGKKKDIHFYNIV